MTFRHIFSSFLLSFSNPLPVTRRTIVALKPKAQLMVLLLLSVCPYHWCAENIVKDVNDSVDGTLRERNRGRRDNNKMTISWLRSRLKRYVKCSRLSLNSHPIVAHSRPVWFDANHTTKTDSHISNAIPQIDFYNCTYAHLFILITPLRSFLSFILDAGLFTFFLHSSSCSAAADAHQFGFYAFDSDWGQPNTSTDRRTRKKFVLVGDQPNDWRWSQTTTATKKNNHLWFAFDKFAVDFPRVEY